MITTDLARKARRSWAIALGLALALGSAQRHATAGDPPDRAEALFQQARDLMGQHDYARACPMLEESYSLDHGAGTLLALALCHEGSGKPASALREYRESLAVAVRANRPDRVMLAESGAQRLEPSVPRITVTPPSPEPSGLAISIDGAPIDRAAMIAGAPVDPGKHVIVASARDAVGWRTSVDVGATSMPVVVRVPSLASTKVEESHAPLAPSRSRTPAWIMGGVSVAALAVGGVFGALSFDAEARSRRECQDLVCSQDGVDLNHEARRNALVSDIGFAVGAVALAASVYLFVRSSPSPSAPSSKAAIGISPRGRDGIGLGATW